MEKHPKNMTFIELISDQITSPRQRAILKLYEDYFDVFHYALGGNNHQAWDGGYADHIADILRTNKVVFEALETIRPVDFTIEEAAMALFFHDLEKPFRYGPKDHAYCHALQEQYGDDYEAWEEAKWNILAKLESDYGFKLTKRERHAIKYAHGEGDEHQKDKRITNALDAHVHHCDNTSARIWPEDGKGEALNPPKL